jgi:hypothetical protein
MISRGIRQKKENENIVVEGFKYMGDKYLIFTFLFIHSLSYSSISIYWTLIDYWLSV